ncbi:phosphatase PAP2 family protein [Bradyrhizobium sp. UFLA03-84]|uniref:phosphatase PAP2 family protein n=1 Tax=Bradyrhizobium sp. UFLA03-84 TaxID=418599 RepID=UPI000BADF454|nr:phosphatase PAP2 family protein [Bradyrhizobium sp. UFLA03-84]PAY04711.1 phosphatase PAP2 family protein [Bradyrhizobium sp. UFLA03-84]
MPITVRPTTPDIAIARTISRNTTPPTERAASILTWVADEHVVCAATLGWWLWCRRKSEPQRLASDHLLVTALAASLVPHLLKSVFDQERPDRLTVVGHLHGIPISGRAKDAFPSGHAIQVGAISSAASQLPQGERRMVRALGACLISTRVFLLAHWASDVVVGSVIGVVLERLIRCVTGYGSKSI